MYSQNNEEQIILDFFGPNFIGKVLDIGANDGKTLSNSLACIERGWIGHLLEPSENAYNKLHDLHAPNMFVRTYKLGIGNKTGFVKFYSSGEHLGKGDSDLLSTAKQSELKRWEGSKNNFIETEALLSTWDDFIIMNIPENQRNFDLISIDVEGLDYDVLSQINLEEVKCKMLIVETNSIADEIYIYYCAKFGMKLYHKNQENLIFVKA
jgi:FkbM family methyltransferase